MELITTNRDYIVCHHFLVPFYQQLHCWSLGMDKLFHPTLYNDCNYWSISGADYLIPHRSLCAAKQIARKTCIICLTYDTLTVLLLELIATKRDLVFYHHSLDQDGGDIMNGYLSWRHDLWRCRITGHLYGESGSHGWIWNALHGAYNFLICSIAAIYLIVFNSTCYVKWDYRNVVGCALFGCWASY